MIVLLAIPGMDGEREDIEIASLKAYLVSKGLTVHLVILYGEVNDTDVADVLPYNFRILGIRMDEINGTRCYKIASLIKQSHPESIIFVFGDLPTNAYSLILQDCSHIDFVVLGDPEETVFHTVTAINNGVPAHVLESIVTRNDIVKKQAAQADVPNLPWPSKDFLQRGGYRSARIYAGRGCCGSCAFCSYHLYYKNSENLWQGRNMFDVYNEVMYLNREYGISNFAFQDESLEDPDHYQKRRIIDFCDHLTDNINKLSFWCYLRPNTFRDEDIDTIKKMRASGFIQVYLGIESNSEQDLRLYGKRNTVEDNARAIRLFTQEGIDVEYGFIMINPLSTEKSLLENYIFLEQNNTFRTSLYTNQLSVIYNTPFYWKMLKQGMLTDQYSYLRPLSYRFDNDFTTELCVFLGKSYALSEIRGYEIKCMSIKNAFLRLIYRFPNDVDVKEGYTKFIDIQKKIGHKVSTYFSILYRENNIRKAADCFTQWEAEMIQLHKSALILYIKMMKNYKYFNYINPLAKKNQPKSD